MRAEEPWWIGLEAVHGDRVFLHGFETPDMPEHKRIIALDLETGGEVWKNDELTFWFAFGSHVYSTRTFFERKTGQILDAGSGAMVEEVENIEDLREARELAWGEDVHHQIDFPEIVDRDSVPRDLLEFLERETGNQELVGGIESVVKEQYAVVTYHRREKKSQPGEPSLESRIAVYNRRERRKVFSEILMRNARMPAPDTFFVKDALFFIKDQKTLSMIPLPDNDASSLP